VRVQIAAAQRAPLVVEAFGAHIHRFTLYPGRYPAGLTGRTQAALAATGTGVSTRSGCGRLPRSGQPLQLPVPLQLLLGGLLGDTDPHRRELVATATAGSGPALAA